MDFLLAGEGPSDLGSLDDVGVLKKGPMAFMVDKLCAENTLPTPNYRHLLSHNQLSKLAAKSSRGGPERPARSEGAKFYDQAAALARETKNESGVCGAIYFQDSDRYDWNLLCRAITLGFKSVEDISEEGMENRCVAMLPRPKSEAWLLAYYQKNEQGQQAYNHAERFEGMSGNDSSPNSVKQKLAEMLECTVKEIYHHIDETTIQEIDWYRVDMPSFNQFKTDFLGVAKKLQEQSISAP